MACVAIFSIIVVIEIINQSNKETMTINHSVNKCEVFEQLISICFHPAIPYKEIIMIITGRASNY